MPPWRSRCSRRCVTAVNLPSSGRRRRAGTRRGRSVSLLIPARDEEAQHRRRARAPPSRARASSSRWSCSTTTRPIAPQPIVAAHRSDDPRLRLVAAPPLPPGWCGKQHACHVLAGHARHPLLVFLDADVRLAPDALARIAGLLERAGGSIWPAASRSEETGTLGEALIVPLIHVLLLGYLPIWLARRARNTRRSRRAAAS